MRLFRLLFGFGGRIDLGGYRLAIVFYTIAMLAITVIAALALGARRVHVEAGIPELISSVPLGVRRLHDRDKSGWWLLALYALPAVLSYAEAPEGTVLSQLFPAASLALTIWAIVELGCLRGTPGPNRFGPEPLAG